MGRGVGGAGARKSKMAESRSKKHEKQKFVRVSPSKRVFFVGDGAETSGTVGVFFGFSRVTIEPPAIIIKEKR